MRWLRAMTNGELKLYKAFWPGLVAFAVFNLLFLRIMGAAVVYERNIFENPLLADKSALELALPALLLLAAGIALGLCVTVVSAGVWQAADRYEGRWPLWPNLAFFLVMLGDVFALAESVVGINLIISTFAKIFGGMPGA